MQKSRPPLVRKEVVTLKQGSRRQALLAAGVALTLFGSVSAFAAEARDNAPSHPQLPPPAPGTGLLSPSQAAVVLLLDSRKVSSDAVRNNLRELQSELTLLETKLNEGAIEVNPDLVVVLSSYATLVAAFGSHPDDAASVAALVRDVRAKNDFSDARAGLDGRSSSLQVEVRVETREFGSDRALTGYRVSASPLFFARQGKWMFHFSSPTNDATRNLPPGTYQFLLEGDGIRFAPQTFDIGVGGRTVDKVSIRLKPGQP